MSNNKTKYKLQCELNAIYAAEKEQRKQERLLENQRKRDAVKKRNEFAKLVNYRGFNDETDRDKIPPDLIANVPPIMDVCPFHEYTCGCIVAVYSNLGENCCGYKRYPEYPDQMTVRRRCAKHNGSRIADVVNASNAKCAELFRMIKECNDKIRAEQTMCEQLAKKDQVEYDPESTRIQISSQFPWSNIGAYKKMCEQNNM